MSVDIRDFIGLLKHSRGDFAGQPFTLEPWQVQYLDTLFNTKRADGLRQYRTSLLALPRKNGKALALDTPVLTTAGWKTMGTVEVGDCVFHPKGYATRVVAATEPMHGRPCYSISFTHGDTIVADEEHLWYTNARIDKPGEGLGSGGTGRPGWRIRTTKEIAESVYCGGRGDRNHGVPVAEPLEMPEAELPIEPYTLGVWLGDGSSQCASVTVSVADYATIDALVAAGTGVTVRKTKNKSVLAVSLGGRSSRPTVCGRGHSVTNGKRCRECVRLYDLARRRGAILPPSRPTTVSAKIRSCGLFGNKHIPDCYKLASIRQRTALLQGLMDTDGTISKAGECEFVSTNRRLAEDFAELATSLGLKVSFKEGVAKLYGRVIGPKYRVLFTPLQPMEVFRLARKQARVKSRGNGSPRSRTRQIAACEQTDSVPVRCIQVDAKDGLFLVGRSLIPTHNSALSAAVGLYMLFCDDVGAEVIVAAGDRSQAALLHTAAKQFVESSALSKRCKIYRNSIVLPERNASMICISSEAGTKHGYNPSCVLVDEYHVFPDRELVDVLETGMGARAQPMTIYITTAGTDKQGPCYKDWERAEKIRDGILEDDTFLPCIYAAPPEADPFIEETWRLANPNYGVTLKPDYFRQMALRAKQSASEEIVFRTLHLNQWCSTATRWIRHGAWEANAEPLRPTADRIAYCGVDLASTTDTTAFVAVWPDEDGTYDIHAHIFIPEERAEEAAKRDRVPYLQWAKEGFVTLTEGDICDYDAVRDYVLSFAEKNKVRAVAIDRYNATHLTTQLVAEGIDVKPFGQGFVSMSAPSKLLETLIIGQKLRHAGNPVLTWQISNVQIKVDDAGNIKPTKKNASSTARIDAAVSLIMALGLCSGESRGPDQEPELLVF